MDALRLPGFDDGNPWEPVALDDPRARWLADRHYSRQTLGAELILPPGERYLLITTDCLAAWGVCHNLDPVGAPHWRVSLFRREPGAALRCSDLIRLATTMTVTHWRRRYGALPSVPLTTEVDPRRIRRKRDPGRCFRKAGWRQVGLTKGNRHRGAIVFEAPAEVVR